VLSFAEADSRVIITPDIEKYKELKLRLLNATHTLSCGLAFLSGTPTVKAAMEDELMSAFITGLMLKEIALAIPYVMPANEVNDFGSQVLDRFRNPYIQHQWLSITMQFSSKLTMRAVPVLLHYYKLHKTVPEYFALGFAAYLLFMKAVKKIGDKYFGEVTGQLYHINDDKAAYYFELWQHDSIETIVSTVFKNEKLWNADLSQIDGFTVSVNQKLNDLKTYGGMQTLERFLMNSV
jgi:tagaturonate reductase